MRESSAKKVEAKSTSLLSSTCPTKFWVEVIRFKREGQNVDNTLNSIADWPLDVLQISFHPGLGLDSSEGLMVNGEEKRWSELWSELPDNLQEKILAGLSIERLCKFRRVCPQWNNLFTSTRFIITQWAQAPRNKNPMLAICDGKQPMRCFTYCFSTGMWKPCLSLSSVQEKPNHIFFRTCYHGSGAGLLLLQTQHFPVGKSSDEPILCQSRTVCNPLTGNYLELPAMASIKSAQVEGIVGWEGGGNPGRYKVVVVGEVDRQESAQSIEIYDSHEKAWTIEGQLPENVKVRGGRMVFCGEFFYCNRVVSDLMTPGILGVSIQDWSCFFTALPEMANSTIRPHLFVCGSRVLVAGCIFKRTNYRNNICGEVIMWELQLVETNSQPAMWWKEIGRIPPSILEDLNMTCRNRRGGLEFEGVGNYVCVRGGDRRILTYSLTEKSWNWLPMCPWRTTEDIIRTYIYSYEPRLDMKVA